jgi:hypothetical protein
MADFLNSTSWISLREARDLVARRLYLGAQIPAYPAQKLLREQLEAGNVRWRCPRIDGRDPLNYYAPGDSRFWELSNPNFRIQLGLRIDWERSSASRRHDKEFEIVASDIEVALDDVMALHRGLERPIVGYTSDESAISREAWLQGASPAQQHEAVLIHRQGRFAAMNLEAARIRAEEADTHQRAATGAQTTITPGEMPKALKEDLDAAMRRIRKTLPAGTKLSGEQLWSKLQDELPERTVTRQNARDMLTVHKDLKGQQGRGRRRRPQKIILPK